jgi:hypothetical protein
MVVEGKMRKMWKVAADEDGFENPIAAKRFAEYSNATAALVNYAGSWGLEFYSVVASMEPEGTKGEDEPEVAPDTARELLAAARCAENVLFLLKPEIDRMGFGASRVVVRLNKAVAAAEGR